MKLDISLAAFEEKAILRNLMQLYLYDFSQIDGTDVDKSGLFSYRYLDQYWVEKERYPFLVRGDGQLVGFALLRRGTYFDDRETQHNTGLMMAEFFVMRNYRRRGVGKQIAFHLFGRFPGRWEIAQKLSNRAAQAFWRKVINEYTGGDYSEHMLDNENWQGPVLVFENALPED
jgi:predicted acetyltransferase